MTAKLRKQMLSAIIDAHGLKSMGAGSSAQIFAKMLFGQNCCAFPYFWIYNLLLHFYKQVL
jgi:hypothetical protein